jgi:hypothetical protein
MFGWDILAEMLGGLHNAVSKAIFQAEVGALPVFGYCDATRVGSTNVSRKLVI